MASEDDSATSDQPVQSSQSEPSSQSSMLQSKMVVLAMLFLVTGFLGIPLLWTSKRFSDAERIFWSISVTIYTLLLLYGAYLVVAWSYRQIFG